jgi:hypothetical protein
MSLDPPRHATQHEAPNNRHHATRACPVIESAHPAARPRHLNGSFHMFSSTGLDRLDALRPGPHAERPHVRRGGWAPLPFLPQPPPDLHGLATRNQRPYRTSVAGSSRLGPHASPRQIPPDSPAGPLASSHNQAGSASPTETRPPS